ncbi:MAG: TAXI family TRAP transporter solute-binding subunit [Desulforhopalus sp.]
MFRYRQDILAISYSARITSTCIFLSLFLFSGICSSNELLIGTGDDSSFSYFAGKTICRSIKNHADYVTCRLVPIEEDADKLTNLQNDSIDLALVSSKSIYDAFHSEGAFRYITIDYNNLRLLMPFYKSPVVLIARGDARISELNDLIKKRVNSGAASTLEHQVFHKIMNIKGWNKEDFPMFQSLPRTFSQDYLALKSGSVQAMLHVGMHPDGSIKLLLNQSQSTLLGIDDPDIMQLVENNTGFSSCRIAADTYPDIKNTIHTMAIETLLVASAATDDDTVQLVLSALIESKPLLQYAHPSFLQQKINVSELVDSYLHPHPSAILFFQTKRDLYSTEPAGKGTVE